MEEIMQDNSNMDLNNNGIPDWAEERQDDWENHPTEPGSPFSFAYKNEKQVANLVPDYKNYKWYKQPGEGYYYSYGEKVEDLVENNPEESKEMLEQIADASDEISEKDVEPLIKEAEQLTDDNPNNDEVSNQAVKEVTQKVFDKMSIEDIEKIDEAAIKGEGDYLTVVRDLGFDDEDLYYFEQAGYKPEDVNNLTEEQKEEIAKEPDKKKKLEKLAEFIKSLPNMSMINNNDSINVNTNQSATSDLSSNQIAGSDNIETNQLPAGTSKPTIGHSFLGGLGGGGASASGGIKVDANINNSNDAHSSASGSKTNVKEMDANTASMNGANKSEHIDNTLDSLSFKETEHEKDIKTDEQADLPSGETWTENNDHWELPDIKKMLSEQGGGTYLPFKFTVENGELYVSQIGTGRKLPFDDFLKAEPFAGKQIIELMNREKI